MNKKKTNKIIEQVDALLPQTQCGLCNHGGCMPYAEAIVTQDEKLNLCPPGGTKTLIALGQLLAKDVTPFIAEMEKAAKPPMLAVIREHECIGCTKCIQACPVDAIVGAAKQMHTVIADSCTGCELCIAPCPVDCIDMVILKAKNETEQLAKSNQWREHFNARNTRLARDKLEQIQKHQQNKLSKVQQEEDVNANMTNILARKAAVQAAIARAKEKTKAKPKAF